MIEGVFFLMAVNWFSSMWSANVIGVCQACEQLKETHLQMAQTRPVPHVFAGALRGTNTDWLHH